MGMSGGKLDGEPMMEMNMTPLIDVLLVLLIMFIITIPVAVNSVDIDLPQPSTNPPPLVEPTKNKLILTPQEQIVWNGAIIDEGQLAAALQQSAQMNPEPELQFEPDAQASYDLSARVLQIIKSSGVTKFGFVGNDKYRSFDK